MSEVQRYTYELGGMAKDRATLRKCSDGPLVLYEDYAAERERSRKLREALDHIRAWSAHHKTEAKTQLRGTMRLVHEKSRTTLAETSEGAS